MCVCVAPLFNFGLFWVGSGVVRCKASNIINGTTLNTTNKREQKGYAGDTGGCIRIRMQWQHIFTKTGLLN